MSLKKTLILGMAMLLSVIILIIIESRIFTKLPIELAELSPEFYEAIQSGNLDDISLTIYYINPDILTRAPLSVIDLINRDEAHGRMNKIIANGSRLTEYIDLLEQLSIAKLKPIEKSSGINARIYYVFETSESVKLLDVAMWGKNGSIYVNDIEMVGCNILYDAVIPFLPEYEAEDLEMNKDIYLNN